MSFINNLSRKAISLPQVRNRALVDILFTSHSVMNIRRALSFLFGYFFSFFTLFAIFFLTFLLAKIKNMYPSDNLFLY